MDPNSRLLMLGSGGSAPVEPVYVEDVFSTWLYTGNGSTQTITNGIDLAGEGGLVWIKQRDSNYNHTLGDTARGTGAILSSNTTNGSSFSSQDIVSYNIDGFTVGSNGRVNSSGAVTGTNKYVSWTFRKTPGFFDVVTYAGNNVSARAIAHSLGSTPGCVIVKKTSYPQNWFVYHRGLSPSATTILYLNGNDASISSSTDFGSTDPTSSSFYVGNSLNQTGATYVAYLFAHDAGGFGDSGNESVIKCGSYTGNGTVANAQTEQPGPDINLGWEPQWVMIKNTTSADGWWIFDTMRGFNVNPNGPQLGLYANTSGAESTLGTSYVYLKLTNTGFKITAGTGAYFNESGKNYIYIAIRRGPMKTPTSGTNVFSSIATVSDTTNVQQAGFPVDLVLAKQRTGAYPPTLGTRLLGGSYLTTNSTSAETAWPYIFFDSNIGYRVSSTGTFFNASSTTNLFFRRAPGFFDVVAYTGNGQVGRTVSHNLGVAPELIIVKQRNDIGGSTFWRVYAAPLGATKNLVLNDTYAALTMSTIWNDTPPTSTVFTLGSGGFNVSSYTYIAYLFATLPGVSKVGSYTGTGTTLDVDCGFTSGARLIIIKRTDSTGDWYVWDTARGIVSGNDPYILLNSTAAEVTSTDYIDPLSSGFQISSTAPAAINASGGTFVFLAIS